MLESLRQLVKLQAVDNEIAVVDGELAKLPGERTVIADRIDQSRQALAAAKELREAEELEERRLENPVQISRR